MRMGNRSEVAGVRAELEALRSERESLTEKIERMNQMQLKKEAEWVHLAHGIREEMAELRRLKE